MTHSSTSAAVSTRNKFSSGFKFLSILLLVLLVSWKSWGQTSYTSTSATGSWNSNRWNNSSDASPYTSAFTANNNASFTSGSYSFINMTASGTFNIGNITLSSNVTVSFTGTSGNLGTGGVMRTFDVGSGATLDLGSQTISTASGTGITKSGNGTLLISQSNAYPGGFTLNAGTIIIGGVSAMGSGGALNLNGGILAASSSRSITARYSAINIGGDITFGTTIGGTGYNSNISFADNVSLGAATRTINLAGTAGTSTYTFSGIISGNSGVGINVGTNSGNGILVLSGVNTYSGNTTINGGTLSLSGSGSIANSPTITIGSGGIFDVKGLTTALSLGASQTLKASATGSNTTGTLTVASAKGLTLSAGGLAFTAYGGGATSPLTVTGASAGALALNSAPVTVTVSTAALTVGTYKLIAKGGSATGVSGTPGTLTVNGLGLASGTTGALSVVSGELILTVTSTTTPDILLADNGTQVAAANVNQGTSTVVLHKFQLGVTTASASLTGMTCTTNGTYVSADITNLKVRYSVDATLDGADVTLSTFTTPGAAGAKTFPSFTPQVITSGTTGYIFITADVDAAATHNNTIGLNAITTGNLTFSSANLTGTTAAGGTQTIKDVTPPTVSVFSPTNSATQVAVASNLVLTFSKNIQKGTGNITIKKYSDNSTIQTIDVTSGNVTVSGTGCTINPPADLAIGVKYYVLVDATAIQDLAGNAYAGIATNTTWNFTTILPTVSNVSSSTANGTYKAGDAINVSITFTDNVTVTGTPQIQLETGTVDEVATYTSGTGTNVLSFTYTVVTGDISADLDYKATGSLGLNGGSINSSDGIAATLTLPTVGGVSSIAGQKAIVVDAVAPTVSTYSPTNSATSVAVAANLVLTFAENIQKGTGNITIKKYSDNSTIQTIDVTSGNVTVSGTGCTINPPADLAIGVKYYVLVDATAIQDLAGNAYAGIATNATWSFTTILPTVSNVSSSTANGTYKAGDAINVSITFTDNVTVTGTPQIQLETGTTDEYATYTSGSGTNVLSFTYTVVTGDVSADLDYKATGSLGLNSGTINSSDGIAATLTLPTVGGVSSIAGQKAIVVDAVAPTVSAYSPTDGNTSVTVSQNLTLTFTETVKAGTAGSIDIYNSAGLLESIPYNDSRITFSTNTVTINPTATFVYGGNYYVQISGTAITDNAGNAYAGIATTTTWNFTTVAPSVTNVTSTNADGTYKVGDVINVTATFTDNVVVTGSPYILLNMVGADRQAAYASGSGTNTLTFSYTLQTSDEATDLDYVTTSSLALNAGTIKSADGINATLTLATPGAANSLGYNKAIVIDCAGPIVSTYSPTDGNTSVTINQDLVLTFNENVKLGTSGSFVIYNSGGTVFETIPYNDGRITFSNATVTINPTATLSYSSDYYVQTTGSPIVDMYDNAYAGISIATTWNFTTVCGAISSFPWTENFDAVTIPAFPTCWFKEGTSDWLTTNNAASTYDADARSGTQFLRDGYTATNEYIWTPGFALTAGTTYDFSFWWAGDTYAGWTGDVFYNTSQISTGATQLGSSFVTSGTTTTKTYAKVLNSFAAPTTGTYYFAIRVNATSAPWYLSLDDFTLDAVSSCAIPTFVSSSSVTSTSATISWTASSSSPSNGYQFEVRTSGNAGSGNTGLVTSGTTAAGVVSKDITGLEANTSYSVYVRSDCGASDYSSWTAVYNFITSQLSATTVTAATGVSSTEFTANWNAVTGSAGYKLDVATNSNFILPATIATESFENSLTLFTQTTGTGSFYSGNSSAGDSPASSAFYQNSSYGYGKTAGSLTITSNTINTSQYSNIQLNFKLASFSVPSGNGADAGDIVTVSISPDGGTNYYSTLRVKGNSNATWAFNATGTASTAYDGNATPVDFTASSSGINLDGLSNITITDLPASSNLKVRIDFLNDHAAERWVADNFTVTGNQNTNLSNYNNKDVSGTSQLVTGLTPNTTYYYRVRATSTNSTSANSETITATTKSTSSVTLNGTTSFTYNGSAQTPAFTKTGSGNSLTYIYASTDGGGYNSTSAAPSAAGAYTVTASVAADASYDAASSSATAFTIAKANTTVTVTVGSYTYTGSAQGPNAVTTASSGTVTYSYVGVSGTTYAASSTQPTAVGNYTVTASVATDANYNAASSSATAFSISAIIATPISGSVSIGTDALLPGTDLTVQHGALLTVDNDSPTTIHSITVNPGGKLTLSDTKSLTVLGNLTLQSGATYGTGTFVDENATSHLTVNGTTTVEQNLATARNWYISSPVTTADRNMLPAGTLWKYNEPNTGVTTNPGTALWDVITSNEALAVMQGYVFKPTTAGLASFTGTLNTGNKSITVNRTENTKDKRGFNLVGNPYPSYLDWMAAIDVLNTSTTNLLTSVWYRSQNAGQPTADPVVLPYYVFDTYNVTANTGTNNNGNGDVTGMIPPMQSFWVRVKASGNGSSTTGTLAVTNAMRAHESGTNRLKAPAVTSQPTLRLQVSNGLSSDETIILFNAKASDGFDEFDSPKMTNGTASIPEIYTIAGVEQLSINGLQTLSSYREMPLGFTTGQTNTFTIKAKEISNFAADTRIYLRDNLLKGEQELTNDGFYTFNSDKTSSTDRFTLIFKTPSITDGINSLEGSSFWISTNADGKILINGTANGETRVNVYNAIGQRLASKNLTSNVSVLDTRLVPGVYTITLTNAGKSATTKVIVK